MGGGRFETLKKFAETRPKDCFVRYGLAQEYIKQGQLAKAVEEFIRILEIDPDYQAAYYHAGQTYLKLGNTEEARNSFQRGVVVARRRGDLHARSELEAALEDI